MREEGDQRKRERERRTVRVLVSSERTSLTWSGKRGVVAADPRVAVTCSSSSTEGTTWGEYVGQQKSRNANKMREDRSAALTSMPETRGTREGKTRRDLSDDWRSAIGTGSSVYCMS